jgi:predicted transcriptional regulator
MASVAKLHRARVDVLRALAIRDPQTWAALARALNPPGLTLAHALAALVARGQVVRQGNAYALTPAGRRRAAQAPRSPS